MRNSHLIGLYEKTLLIRFTEEMIARRYKEQKMRCPLHLSIGQEGVAAGVCASLGVRDCVYSTHRCHAHYIAKGGNLKKMIAELYGKATGCTGGKGGSMHLIDVKAGFGGATPLVGNTLAIAVGVAFAKKIRKEKGIVVVFFGDAAVEEGIFHESLNFASLHKLPILFICENNFIGVYTPLDQRQPERPIVGLAASHGIVSEQAQGYHAVTVFDVVQKHIRMLRGGNGPAFVEFFTSRWAENCGPNTDDDLGYRDSRDITPVERGMHDPIPLLETLLLKKKLAVRRDFAAIKKTITASIEGAFSFAEKSPFPPEESLHENLFAN